MRVEERATRYHIVVTPLELEVLQEVFDDAMIGLSPRSPKPRPAPPLRERYPEYSPKWRVVNLTWKRDFDDRNPLRAIVPYRRRSRVKPAAAEAEASPHAAATARAPANRSSRP